MKKIKVLTIIMILFVLMSISVSIFAAESVDLDLKTAVVMAMENDLDLKIAKMKFEKSELEYQKNIANNLSNVSRYNELEAEISLKSAENTYQSTEYQVILDTFNQYIDLWLAAYDLQIKGKQLELEKRLVKEARAQYEIGDIGAIDLLEHENDYNDVVLSQETARDDYQQSIREFNNKLNLDDVELLLADLNYDGSWQITEDKAINTTLKNSLSILLSEKSLELAKIDLDRAAISAAALDRKIKEKSVEAARLEQENTINDLKITVRSDYYQFKQMVKKIDLTNERLLEAQEKYKLRKKQYDVGLLTVTELMEYEVNLMDAQYNYFSAVANYYLAEQSLRQQMNLRFGGIVDEISEEK